MPPLVAACVLEGVSHAIFERRASCSDAARLGFNLLRSRESLGGAQSASPDATLDGCSAGERWTLLPRRLREGRVLDAELDDVYSMSVRSVSSSFWTPVAVAMRASKLLVADTSTRVLDVGAGAGKFCIVGAAVTGATFIGVEHREHLVHTARAAAERLGVDRASFVHGTLDAVDVAAFDAIYFFNPFEENVWCGGGQLDDMVDLSVERCLADIELAEKMLADARIGTRVVTYHGFGGEMPVGYERAIREPLHSGFLELWVKGR